MSGEIWRTRDGRRIPVVEMSREHVDAVMRRMESRIAASFLTPPTALTHEAAMANAASFLHTTVPIYRALLTRRANCDTIPDP